MLENLLNQKINDFNHFPLLSCDAFNKFKMKLSCTIRNKKLAFFYIFVTESRFETTPQKYNHMNTVFTNRRNVCVWTRIGPD